MAKTSADVVLDGLLDIVATATLLTVCNAQPTTYTEASATFKLADVAIDGTDFTKANDTSGRKVTIGEQAAVPVDTTDTATHIALSISGSSTLLCVTTCTSQALTQGNTVTVPAFKIAVADPT